MSSSSSFVHDGATGAVAGLILKTLTTPVDRIKMLGYTASLKTPSLWETAKQEGVRSLWRGHLTNMQRYVPHMFLLYGTFGWARKKMEAERRFWPNAICGAAVNGITLLSLHPLDMTRLALRKDAKTLPRQYKSFSDAFKQLSFRELYRHCGISIAGVAVYQGSRMGTFFYLTTDDSSLLRQVGAAVLAVGLGNVLSHPEIW